MAAIPDTESGAADREIVIIRVIDAPRDLVFQAFSDPEHITHWWGPDGFTTTTHAMDFQPGGVWRFVMHGPDGRDYQNRVVYDEIVRPERLTYHHGGAGKDGEPVTFHTTVSFDEQAGAPEKTRITLRMVLPSTGERDRVKDEYGAVEGGMQTVARLADHLAAGRAKPAMTVALPSDREIVLTRTFDAPRDLVFEACTKPEHVRRWWGPRAFALVACEMDFRVGGSWRFVQRDPDGQEYPFRGEYKEIVPPERIVQTFVYDVEGIRDYPTVETAVLEERDGKTILTTTVLHQSRESRDGQLHSGMEVGAAETYDRLADLLTTLAAAGATKAG